MDGLVAIARLRAIEGSQHVRIVVYSARGDRRQQALDAGAAAFVHKPDIAALNACIDSLVGA
jgi:CheY-like chemotaxis protein